MAYIKLNNSMPGIVGLLWNKPSTGRKLAKFAHTLLKGPSPLSSGERELIASYVSSLNQCNFCCNSHSSAATHYYSGNETIIESVKANPDTAKINQKLKALLVIAGKVQKSGREVNENDIKMAINVGATDEEIHDTVLIAAAFCMFNRYVDGLGTLEPEDKEEYVDMGKRMANKGYRYPNFIVRKIITYLKKRKEEKSR